MQTVRRLLWRSVHNYKCIDNQLAVCNNNLYRVKCLNVNKFDASIDDFLNFSCTTMLTGNRHKRLYLVASPVTKEVHYVLSVFAIHGSLSADKGEILFDTLEDAIERYNQA